MKLQLPTEAQTVLCHHVQINPEVYPALYPMKSDTSSPSENRPGRDGSSSLHLNPQMTNNGPTPALPITLSWFGV